MSYNLSKKTVYRNARYLDDLCSHQTLHFPSKDSQELARSIREALRAAEFHGAGEFPRYQELRFWYVFKAKKGYVEARFIGPPDVGIAPSQVPGIVKEVREAEVPAPTPIPAPVAVEKKEPTVFVPTQKTLTDVISLEGIVGAGISFAVECDELNFPNAILSEEEMNILYTWTQNDKTWKLIDEEEAGLTLTQKEVESIYLWRP